MSQLRDQTRPSFSREAEYPRGHFGEEDQGAMAMEGPSRRNQSWQEAEHVEHAGREGVYQLRCWVSLTII